MMKKQNPVVQLTDLEQRLLIAALYSPMGKTGWVEGESPLVSDVLEEAEISHKIGRGVLSSLIRKGMITVMADNIGIAALSKLAATPTGLSTARKLKKFYG